MTNEEIFAVTKNKWISELDSQVLCDYARLVPKNGAILDIGAGPGTSICIMALASRDSVKLYGIDPFFKSERFTRFDGLEGKIFLIAGETQKVGLKWNIPIDLLFHDAIHSYSAVIKDTLFYAKFVRPNGYILWHDYKLYRAVGQAVDDFMTVNSSEFEKVEQRGNIYVARRRGKIQGSLKKS